MTDTAKAIDALHSIPPDLPRDEWVKVAMGAHAAGVDFDTFDTWSAGAGNYDAAAARDVWRSRAKPTRQWVPSPGSMVAVRLLMRTMVATSDLKVVFANRAFETLFGFSPIDPAGIIHEAA